MLDAGNPLIGSILDLSSSGLCFAIAIGCVYLAQVILKEHAPMLDWQRGALYFVAGASFMNAFTYWPEWALIAGHRPTGLLLNLAFCVLVVVMMIRGNVVNGSRMRPPKPPGT